MASQSGRFVVTYNGEIYNFRELRQELESSGYRFRTQTDTEVLANGVEYWGVASIIQKMVGMFAFGVWDCREKKLTLVRDRIGIKPLYYGWTGNYFAFASEIQSFRVLPDWSGLINRAAIAPFMRLSYIPCPYSIYGNIFKLPQGSSLELSWANLFKASSYSPIPDDDNALSPHRYWRVEDYFQHGYDQPFAGSERDADDEVERLLRQSVKLRLVADVPVGAFLSGGIDSASIVSLMQSECSRPVKTFTVGIEGHGYDETSDAKELSRKLLTDHTECRVSEKELLALVPSLVDIYDEPFADSSQIPTYLVSKLAGESVTVVLSGDGGDEVFGGYNRYLIGTRMIRFFRRLPLALRRHLPELAGRVNWKSLDRNCKRLAFILPKSLTDRSLSVIMPKIADLLSSRDGRDAYAKMTAVWNASVVVDDDKNPFTHCFDISRVIFSTDAKMMMCADLLGYHCDDILTKLDRASMAVGIEARVPFVDHRLVEFAATLPEHHYMRNGQGKTVLRRLLRKLVPDYAPCSVKRGFSVPLADWLRGPLREWAESLLNNSRIKAEGVLNPDVTNSAWLELINGADARAYAVWNLLVFQAYLGRHSASGRL